MGKPSILSDSLNNLKQSKIQNPKSKIALGKPITTKHAVGWWRQGLAWAEPLGIFLGWRVGLALLAFAALFLLPGVDHAGTAPRIPLETGSFYERFWGVWSHWDGEWFLHVAQAGYLPGEATSPFFPLYPTLVRLVAFLTLGNYLVAGVLVSSAASLLAFVLLYELVKTDFGPLVASRSVLYLAIFPTSFFLTACYSESVFLAATLGAFLAARRYSNWALVGLLVGLAALSRNLGILLLLPLGWEWWRQHQTSRVQIGAGRWRLQLEWRQLSDRSTVLFVALPVLMFGGWLLYNLVALGDPLNFITVQSTPVWNRHRAWPWEPVLKTFDLVLHNPAPPFRDNPNLLDLAFWVVSGLVFVGALWLAWRGRLPGSYLIFFAIALILPLSSPANKEPLLSFPRFALVIWPLFVALGQWGARRAWFHYLYLFAAALLLALLFGRFANWQWVA